MGERIGNVNLKWAVSGGYNPTSQVVDVQSHRYHFCQANSTESGSGIPKPFQLLRLPFERWLRIL